MKKRLAYDAARNAKQHPPVDVTGLPGTARQTTRRTRKAKATTLEELLAGPRATVPPASPSTEPEPAVVDVRSLVYRGDRALARAQELRAAARQATGDSLLALVDEVCDLVALALEPNPGSARS